MNIELPPKFRFHNATVLAGILVTLASLALLAFPIRAIANGPKTAMPSVTRRVICGDCVRVLPTLPDASVDAERRLAEAAAEPKQAELALEGEQG